MNYEFDPLYEVVHRMSRSQLKRAVLRERAENVRLQKRIAEQRANWRRFSEAVHRITAENAARRAACTPLG